MRLSQLAIVLEAAVATLAIIPVATLFALRFRFDDEFYPASSEPEERCWATTSPPRIVVDVQDDVYGTINVTTRTESQVSASVTRKSLCKNLSQSVAEDALRFVHVEMAREGDTIRIVVRPTEDMPKNDFAKTGTYINVSTMVVITVPSSARLERFTSG